MHQTHGFSTHISKQSPPWEGDTPLYTPFGIQYLSTEMVSPNPLYCNIHFELELMLTIIMHKNVNYLNFQKVPTVGPSPCLHWCPIHYLRTWTRFRPTFCTAIIIHFQLDLTRGGGGGGTRLCGCTHARPRKRVKRVLFADNGASRV